MEDGLRHGNDNGLHNRLQDGSGMEKEARKERVYLKDATVTVDVGNVKDARVADIIKAVTERIGNGGILAVRPKQAKEYEVTLEREEDTEFLTDGLMINGINCEVKRLQNRDYVVTFMHLPAYLADEEILNKLMGWGVSPISKIKRRVYPGTSIEDGTKYVRTRFPKEVASLPYCTKIETAEGLQYFRVMHSHQPRPCNEGLPGVHVLQVNCNAVMCPDCNLVLNRCECWMEGKEEDEERQVGGQIREEETSTLQDDESTAKEVCDRQDGNERHMDITDSSRDVLDEVERNDQRNNELNDSQQDVDLWTQMSLTDSLLNILDTVERNEQRNREQEAAKESEEKEVKSAKRRRSVKVTPNLLTARKKVLNEDVLKCVNKYDLLKDLEERD
ncbi:hypothetical protein M9458_057673 [Cirrhinus mrigala]|uniref:Uncharacterized protein n=1 Tax=Cirrhinus mrigala TaxID=683832 RepID=A0ABD0MB63_CIRMR